MATSSDAAPAAIDRPLTDDEAARLKELAQSLKSQWYVGRIVEKTAADGRKVHSTRTPPPLIDTRWLYIAVLCRLVSARPDVATAMSGYDNTANVTS